MKYEQHSNILILNTTPRVNYNVVTYNIKTNDHVSRLERDRSDMQASNIL